MINRVESFNGQVSIESSPGNGCRINISIPYYDEFAVIELLSRISR
jgi:chemotaxis protein histidine kinase CheA